jgi:alginate O-acetyltransferase complex protein AlgI
MVALGASLIFYVWGAPIFFWLLISVLVINFYCVKQIHTNSEATKKKLFLVFSLVLNLGVLAYFKYANFFIENINLVLGSFGTSSISWIRVALPIGISFFTFQSITYTLDVFWRKHDPLEKITDYLLYILLFPQLIAGPIIRFNTIADEIKDRTINYTYDYKLNGWYIFIIGLAKKVFIANEIGEQVDLIFAQTDGVSVYLSWVGIVAYSIQIYFDFSGYSDMAIGLGKMMGFNFPENFKNPYTSKSITEFWRKWHITLGTFMRDYLYIPLGGNQVSKRMVYRNLIFVFLLSGLWHGASWNFVIWGAWHGIFLILERVFLNNILKKLPSILTVSYTYFVVLIGWVFFRTEQFSEAIVFIKNMFGIKNPIVEMEAIPSEFYVFLAIGLVFAFITMTSFGKKLEQFLFYSTYSNKQHVYLSISSVAVFAISIGYIAASGFNPFIYFRF